MGVDNCSVGKIVEFDAVIEIELPALVNQIKATNGVTELHVPAFDLVAEVRPDPVQRALL